MIETRNYFYLRIRGTIYTVLLVVVIVLSLLFNVFGTIIADFLVKQLPFLTKVIYSALHFRQLFTFVMTGVVAWAVYCFLPNRKIYKPAQIPGTLFTALGWVVCSWVFSKFTIIFKGFSNMYGSLTMIILFLMWISMCMYILLLGAEVNQWMWEFEVYEKIPWLGKKMIAGRDRFIAKTREQHIELMMKQAEKSKIKEFGKKKS